MTEIKSESDDQAFVDHVLRGELNQTNAWQGIFRIGWLDLVALKYGTSICGPLDVLSLTHLDTFQSWLSAEKRWRVCLSYQYTGNANKEVLEQHFDWELRSENIICIRAIKLNSHTLNSSKVAELLHECRPLEHIEIPHQNESREDGVAQLVKLLEEHLHLRVHIGSFGPTKSNKQFFARDDG